MVSSTIAHISCSARWVGFVLISLSPSRSFSISFCMTKTQSIETHFWNSALVPFSGLVAIFLAVWNNPKVLSRDILYTGKYYFRESENEMQIELLSRLFSDFHSEIRDIIVKFSRHLSAKIGFPHFPDAYFACLMADRVIMRYCHSVPNKDKSSRMLEVMNRQLSY